MFHFLVPELLKVQIVFFVQEVQIVIIDDLAEFLEYSFNNYPHLPAGLSYFRKDITIIRGILIMKFWVGRWPYSRVFPW